MPRPAQPDECPWKGLARLVALFLVGSQKEHFDTPILWTCWPKPVDFIGSCPKKGSPIEAVPRLSPVFCHNCPKRKEDVPCRPWINRKPVSGGLTIQMLFARESTLSWSEITWNNRQPSEPLAVTGTPFSGAQAPASPAALVEEWRLPSVLLSVKRIVRYPILYIHL